MCVSRILSLACVLKHTDNDPQNPDDPTTYPYASPYSQGVTCHSGSLPGALDGIRPESPARLKAHMGPGYYTGKAEII